jgi:hypothetical protein
VPTADFNPYAAPQVTETASTARLIDPGSRGIWRDGHRVVIPHGAVLPTRCWKCNGPADVLLGRRLYWLHPAWLLLILLHVLILLLVAAFVHKKATFAIGLCDNLAVAWLLSIAGFALTIGAAIAYYDSAIPLLTGLATFLVGLVYGAFFASVCGAKRIDKYAAWVTGAGENFLAVLPSYPAEL